MEWHPPPHPCHCCPYIITASVHSFPTVTPLICPHHHPPTPVLLPSQSMLLLDWPGPGLAFVQWRPVLCSWPEPTYSSTPNETNHDCLPCNPGAQLQRLTKSSTCDVGRKREQDTNLGRSGKQHQGNVQKVQKAKRRQIKIRREEERNTQEVLETN